MDDDLRLWKISHNNRAVGTYDAAIVVAWTDYDARRIHPNGVVIGEVWTGFAHISTAPGSTAWDTESWCAVEDVDVACIGIAGPRMCPGRVIMRSFIG